MGDLDDAIREHLELKRRRGADPAEVARQEQEALAPVTRSHPVVATPPSAEPEHEHEPELEHAYTDDEGAAEDPLDATQEFRVDFAAEDDWLGDVGRAR